MRMSIKKKVLITGSKGLLGIGLLQTLPSKWDLIPTVHKNTKNDFGAFKFITLDICDRSKVFSLFESMKPDVVIHTASLGNVDYCENHKREAHSVNVRGTQNIVRACEKVGSKLIFTSTNAVFDGMHPPYHEKSKLHPLNYYGLTKVKCEKMLAESKLNYCIVRLLLMYGWNHPKERSNPVVWMIENLKNGKKMNLVNDIKNNPMLNIEAAKCIWKVIDMDLRGIIHVAGSDTVTRYDLGKRVARAFALSKGCLSEVESSFFGDIAPRMPDTTYDTTKMRAILKIKPKTVAQGLKYMKEHPLCLD